MFLLPSDLSYLCKSRIFEKYNVESLKLVTTAGVKMNSRILQQLKNSLYHALVIPYYGWLFLYRVKL